MLTEDLNHFEPSEEDFRKFERINAMPDEQWERECVAYNDCSICTMAIHTALFSTTKHTCTYGISKERFIALMDDVDASY